MKNARLPCVVAALVALPITALAVWNDDETTPPIQKEGASAVTTDASESAFDYGAGAGGLEPIEAIEEDPGAAAHRAWVESIWNSP